MSFIKTMKGQHVEAGANISDWPLDGLIAMYAPCDEVVAGPALAPTIEIINEQTNGSNNLVADCDGTSCSSYSGLTSADALSSLDPDLSSFVAFIACDFPTGDDVFTFGSATGVTRLSTVLGNMQVTVGNTSYIGSNSDIATGGAFTDAAVDQLALCIIDREHEEARFYEGTGGDELALTFDFTALNSNPATKGTPFNWDKAFRAGNSSNVYGYGMLVFPRGIPTNIHTIMQYINTEIRAGRKYAWMNDYLEMATY